MPDHYHANFRPGFAQAVDHSVLRQGLRDRIEDHDVRRCGKNVRKNLWRAASAADDTDVVLLGQQPDKRLAQQEVFSEQEDGNRTSERVTS
jgi:hypothetical protein